MTGRCAWCDGGCAGADLAPLLVTDLAWLWARVAAAADRRGDPDMATGTLNVTAPTDPGQRHAAAGLLGGRPLRPGQGRRVDLADLTGRLTVRGPALTPGTVAAHATGRRLAARAAAAAAQADLDARLRTRLLTAADRVPEIGDHTWARLVRAGWVARLRATEDPEGLVDRVLAVAAALPGPGQRRDRRQLGEEVLDDPHGLDDGQPVPGLVLGLLAATDRVHPGLRPREAWESVGVDYDDLTGGLLVCGIAPTGWSVPAGTVATVPPRELARCGWPAPPPQPGRVWVTENPSVLAAAADLAGAGVLVRMVCTAGTPSAVEVAALGRLAAAGWRLAVRADFDAAGLAHVRAMLAGAPGAVPWRMRAEDYRASVARSPGAPPVATDRLGESPWDPELVAAMRECGVAAFEETLLAELLADVTDGH